MNVIDFPGKGGDGGGGPDDPTLAMRVSALEARFGQMELKIDRIVEALRRVEVLLEELRSDNRDFRQQLADVAIKVAGVEGLIVGVEGRLSMIPTTWQIVAILATLLIGLSGIIFTTSKFVHP